MPVPQSPSATPTFPNTISPPVDGDPLSAPQLNSDDLTPIQNGVEAARLLLYGRLNRKVACTSNTVMVVQPLGAVMVTVGGTTWTVKAHTAPSTIDPSALSGGLVANTRYWVYVSLVAGVVTFTVSTTAPDAGIFYKSGDTNYEYVSTFVTDNAGNIALYTQNDRQYTYSAFNSGGVVTKGNLILWQGAAVVATTVAFSTAVPTQVVGYVELRVGLATGVAQLTQIAPVGGISGGTDEWAQYITQATRTIFNFPWSTNRGLSLDYTNNDASARTDIWVERFTL